MTVQPLTCAVAPDFYDVLVTIVHDPAVTDVTVAGAPPYEPVTLARIAVALLGDSVRWSEAVERREVTNRRTRDAWGFHRLDAAGHWTLVGDYWLVISEIRDRAAEFLANDMVAEFFASEQPVIARRIRESIRRPLQQRKGAPVTMLCEVKRIGSTIPDIERDAWLADFLRTHFSGTVRASDVSRGLKSLDYPYAFDGGEVKERALDALGLDRGSRLPQLHGYEVFRFDGPEAWMLEPSEGIRHDDIAA